MLKIFNTLTGVKEVFKSIQKNKINLYVCGVTVYDFCHIGHGRTFVAFDMIVRYLRFSGFQVQYVRNITDIDDKIILKALQKKININTLTDFMIQEMNKDFSSLGIIPPDQEPRVTEHIDNIIQVIQQLIDNQHAYVNQNGDVFFSINSDDNYGQLSGQSLQLLQSRLHAPVNNTKKNVLDFVLWKSSQDEYTWNSPWGKGRPGWHIECSAITNFFLKNVIDIHGGGSDLIFPHHENEKSQSTCFNKKLQINFWMHTGLLIINNQKMSKSLDNFYFLRDILKKYDPEVLRYFFLATHYRHPINYCETNLSQASISLKYLYSALSNTNPISSNEGSLDCEFYNAMNDDFNTPKAFSILFKIARKINLFKNIDVLKANLFAFKLRYLANSLGLLVKHPTEFLQQRNQLSIDIIKKIEFLINKRNIARQLKSWKEADNIREKLMSWNIIVEDLSNGTTVWRKK